MNARVVLHCSCYKPILHNSYQLLEEIEPYSALDWPANMIAKEWEKIDRWRYTLPDSRLRNENYLGRHCKAYHKLLDTHIRRKQILFKRFFEFYGPGNITGSEYRKLTGPETGQYPSDFAYMFELSRELTEVGYQFGRCERRFLQKIKCTYRSEYGGVILDNYKKDMLDLEQGLICKLHDIKNTEDRVNNQFRKLHSFCMRKHSSLRTYYEYGLSELRFGNYFNAVETIEQLVSLSKDGSFDDYLASDTYLKLGIACSNSLQYSNAIAALNEAIEKNPALKEAYLERAVAYFEIGDFDQAIRDYITSDQDAVMGKSQNKEKIDFGKGFMKGALRGLNEGMNDAPSSLWNSVKGVGQVIWAGIKDPIHIPERMINATGDLINYLTTQELHSIAQDIAPELHDLVTNWHLLDQKTKGEKTGLLVGKYGVDILFCYGTTKGVQLFGEVKKVNSMCNLKTLATSRQAKAALIESAQYAAEKREMFFKSAKIHSDKQGKHIMGHRNYRATNSVLTHPDPERLLRDHAGKGMNVKQELAGSMGYKEVIDFEEVIGECLDHTGASLGTTLRGTIHYDKNGNAHIVPAPPKKK